MPIRGSDRMPGTGLALGTLFDKDLNTSNIETSDLTITNSLVFERATENKYTIAWTEASGADRILTIPALASADTFVFADATQTLTNKALTGLTDLDMTAGNKTILDTIGSNTLTIGAGGTTVTIAGNLTVSGATTTKLSETLQVEDSLYVLNHGETGTPSEDSGFIVERGSSTNVGLIWDESADEFTFINTASTGAETGDVTIASYADMQANGITGTSVLLDGDKSVNPTDGGVIHIDTHTITDSSTSGSGTATRYSHVNIEAPALAATNSSVTTSDASTLRINGPVTAGTNQTLTRAWSLWVDSGNVRFDGSIYSGTTEAINSSGLVTVAAQSGITSLGTLTALTVDDITIDGSTISDSGALTVDIGGNIDLDTGGTEILLSSAGTQYGRIGVNHSDLSGGIILESTVSDKDVRIRGNDGGSMIDALHFDMSSNGGATFYGGIYATDRGSSAATFRSSADSGDLFKIDVTTHGATTLTTIDDDAAAANLQITADGTVDIDSAGVLTLDSGAAINIEPASGSAILLDGTISIDAGVVTGATSITSTAFVGDVTGNVSGTAATVTTAAQGNITSLGTLTTLTVDNIIINGTTIGHTSATDAMTIASSGAVTFKSGVDFTTGQDIIVGDDLKMTTDDAHIAMGGDTDLLISHRGLALSADATLGGAIVGSPDHPGVAANSMIISNQTTDGDIMLIGSDGGNSVAYYLMDSSANTHYFSGTTNLQAIDVNGTSQFDGEVTVGVDDTGHDVKFFGATASAYMLWDESADDLLLAGDARMGIGTTNTAYGYLSIDAGGESTRMVRLGGTSTTSGNLAYISRNLASSSTDAPVVRIREDHTGDDQDALVVEQDGSGNILTLKDGGSTVFDVADGGAVTAIGTLTVGVDDTGHDVKFFGATASSYMLWDESANSLLVNGAAGGNAKIGINDPTPGQTFSINEMAETNIIYQRTFSDTTGQHNKFYMIKSHSDTFEANATTLDTEIMGEFKFYGVNGAGTPAQTEVANIKVQQQGTAGSTYNAADIILSTSSDSAALTERMRINSTGGVQIGAGEEITQRVIGGGAQVNGRGLQVDGEDEYPGISITSWSADAKSPYFQLSSSNNNTAGTMTATDDGTSLGYIRFEGVDTTPRFDVGATIQSVQVGSAGSRVPADLRFTTSTSSSPTEKMRITTTGLVGIGETSPDHLLTLANSAATSQIELRGGGVAGGGAFFCNYDNQTAVMSAGVRVNAGSWTADTTQSAGSGAASIYAQVGSTHYWYSNGSTTDGNNISPAQVFTIVAGGNATLAGTLTESSDVSLKTNINTIDSALNKVNQMRGVSYDRIDTNISSTGLIAQELEKIAPELVQDNEEYKSVSYTKLTAYLVEAIKELSNKIKELEAK